MRLAHIALRVFFFAAVAVALLVEGLQTAALVTAGACLIALMALRWVVRSRSGARAAFT